MSTKEVCIRGRSGDPPTPCPRQHPRTRPLQVGAVPVAVRHDDARRRQATPRNAVRVVVLADGSGCTGDRLGCDAVASSSVSSSAPTRLWLGSGSQTRQSANVTACIRRALPRYELPWRRRRSRRSRRVGICGRLLRVVEPGGPQGRRPGTLVMCEEVPLQGSGCRRRDVGGGRQQHVYGSVYGHHGSRAVEEGALRSTRAGLKLRQTRRKHTALDMATACYMKRFQTTGCLIESCRRKRGTNAQPTMSDDRAAIAEWRLLVRFLIGRTPRRGCATNYAYVACSSAKTIAGCRCARRLATWTRQQKYSQLRR